LRQLLFSQKFSPSTHELETKPIIPSAPSSPKNRTPKKKSEGIEDLIKNKQRLLERFQLFGLREKRKIPGDGNCQFAAFADQLFSTPRVHQEVRRISVEWLRQNPNFEVERGVYLRDFLEMDCFGNWEEYCNYMAQDGTWGDHMTLIALSEVFECSVIILSSVELGNNSASNPVTIIEPKTCKSQKVILLSHLHEKHYGSLVYEGVDEE